MGKLFRTDEVGEALQIKKATVQAMIRAGRIPALKVGKHYRITEETLSLLMKHGVPASKGLGPLFDKKE